MSLFLNTQKQFESQNWRLTAGVRNILQILDQTQKFISANTIQETLADIGKKIDLVTVYRILGKLKSISVIHEENGKWIKCIDPDNEDEHHFLTCNQCGKSEEIFLDYRDGISEQLAREKKFLLKEVHLSFQGICTKCINQE